MKGSFLYLHRGDSFAATLRCMKSREKGIQQIQYKLDGGSTSKCEEKYQLDTVIPFLAAGEYTNKYLSITECTPLLFSE